MKTSVSRRELFRFVTAGAAGVAIGTLGGRRIPVALGAPVVPPASPPGAPHAPAPAHAAGSVGEVNPKRAAIDPMRYLTHFDWGKETRLPGGRTLREYKLVATDREVEVAPGVLFPAWTYNGQVPGPTLRAREGDRLRIHFINAGSHPHNIHFHGFHAAGMDGIEPIETGKSFVYEFDAEPFGLHLYHCHVMPLARHIAKGLYGAFIIDPKEGRPPVDREFVMVMHGLDIDFDDENDFYAVNGIPFHYQNHPITIKAGEKVRVYLVNILEFDLLNSFHLHANFFHYYPTGTSLTPSEYTDTVIQGQAQRGILEFSYKYPGLYMFHAHVTEFTELGWTGLFKVEEA